jgi:hypothetical protein
MYSTGMLYKDFVYLTVPSPVFLLHADSEFDTGTAGTGTYHHALNKYRTG